MKIIDVRPLDGFKLHLRFDDGVSGVADVSSFAGRGVFSAWLETGVFEQVRVTDIGAIEWPGEIDLCPDSLYLRVTGKSPQEIFPALRAHPSHA